MNMYFTSVLFHMFVIIIIIIIIIIIAYALLRWSL